MPCEYAKFAAGAQFATSGMAKDDICETSFTLSGDADDLSLDMLSLMGFAVRLTSVGEEGGARAGPLKIGETAPEVVPEPDEPANIANDESMTVRNRET